VPFKGQESLHITVESDIARNTSSQLINYTSTACSGWVDLSV